MGIIVDDKAHLHYSVSKRLKNVSNEVEFIEVCRSFKECILQLKKAT